LADKYSWLQNAAPRPDGLPKRPTPYDEKFQPKLLRDAIVQAPRGGAVASVVADDHRIGANRPARRTTVAFMPTVPT